MGQMIRIDCINKANRFDPNEKIRSVGGENPDGSRWKLTEEQAILGMKQGKWEFYVERPIGFKVKVVIAQTADGTEYLKTEADSRQPDNLLSLPECR
jgi:Protein of unknown function (DUF3892)